MADLLNQSRWALIVRGLIAVLFGVVAFAWPSITLMTLVLLFGAYALVDGIASIIGALKNRAAYRHWWVVLMGGFPAWRRDWSPSLGPVSLR